MASVKNEIAKGVFWIALSKYSGVVISLAVTAILARNVAPEAFGTMAVANVVINFLSIFVDMGIGVAVIQFKDLTQRQLNTLFTLGNYIGIVLAVILFFGAGAVATYYRDPVIINVCRWLCISVILNSLNIVPNGLMMRDKRFKTVAIRTLSFQLLSGTIAGVAAIGGWGIYALLVTPILSPVGVLCVNYYNYPCRFVLNMDKSVIRKVWKYSSFQFLFALTNYFSRNIDTLIIGKCFSMAQLGYYDKAYRLMKMPLQYVTFVIGPVLHPILSDLQNDMATLAQKSAKLIKIVSQISFPTGVFCYFAASPIIHIVFGDDWDAAIPVFSILAISLPLQMILSLSGALFQAAGHTNHMFSTGILNTIVTTVGFFIAAFVFHTLEAMAWAWTITLTINFLTTYYAMFRWTFTSDIKLLWYSIKDQIVNSAITLIPIILSAYYINQLPYAVQFVVLFIITITLTLVVASLSDQYDVKNLIKKAMKNFKHR